MAGERLSLTGKAAVVTGASNGIGLAVSRALAAEGVRVAMFARSPGPLAEAAASIGERALAVPTDVSDPDAVRKGFERVRAEFGRLDILVNNAAVGRVYTLETANDDVLMQEVGTNLLGVIYCTRSAIPLMRASGGGDIVNVTSEAAVDPFPYLTVYSATKAATEALTEGTHRELKADGIRATALRVGRVMTGSKFGENWDQDVAAKAFATWLAGRYIGTGNDRIQPETVAQALIQIVTLPHPARSDIVVLRPA